MDLDFQTVFSIVELIGGIKETYQSFTHKKKPVYNNRPQFRYPNKFPPPRTYQKQQTNRKRSFWI